ncbi:MAG: hypothetical protein NTW10_09780 [Bacteroidetes bacterium]|nr:hypothetical protein [Bacteroidota bacterium]
MANQTSQHIMSAAATLLGFCLFVITSMHIFNYADKSVVDEFTSGVAFFLIVACLFSFLSIRSKDQTREKYFEIFADYLFIISLSGIMIIIALIGFHVIK